jgi:hypothetical protein
VGFPFAKEEVSDDISSFVFGKGLSERISTFSKQICRKERKWSLLQTLIHLSPSGR